MALTKVTGGILSQPIDLGITTATTGFFSGIVTAQSVRVLGDLTVDGSTTTLDTVVTEVDRLEVGANNVTVGVAITQSGTGDILKLYDSSTPVFAVKDGGKVGIGTDNPLQKLHVTDGTSANIYIETKKSDTGSTAGLYYKTSSSAASDFFKTGIVLEDDGTSHARGKLHILQNNTADGSNATLSDSVVTFSSNGRVGIGTTIPTQILHILDSNPIIQFTDPDNGLGSRINADNGNLYFDTHNQNRDVVFRGGNSSTDEVARITGDGKVGIGTGAPTVPLQINHVSPKIILEDNDNGADVSIANIGGAAVYSSQSDVLFQTADTSEKLRIASNGNVGINSTSPATKLDVRLGAAWIYPDDDGTEAIALKLGKLADFNSSFSDILVADNDGSSSPTYQVTNKINRYIANWHFDRVTSPGATRINAFKFRSAIEGANLGNKFTIRDRHDTIDSVRLWSEGNSFIGVSTAGATINFGIGIQNPVAKLHVHNSGTTAADHAYAHFTTGDTGSDASSGLTIGVNATQTAVVNYREAGTLTLNTSSTPRIVILSNGKVGIGTENPQEKLDVVAGGVNNAAFFKTSSDKALIEFENGAGSTYNTRIGSMTIGSGNVGLMFETGTSSDRLQAMVIDRYGKVGIGTNNAGTKLDVFGFFQVKDETGKLSMQMDGANGNFKVFQSPAGWTNLDYNPNPILGWDFKSGPGDLMYMASGGNTATASQMALVISDTHGFKVGRSGYDGTDLDVSPTAEYFRIATGGNVGIGTNSPQEILHIHNDGTGPCDVRISNNEGYGFLRSDSNLLAYNAQLHLFANRDRSVEYMRITNQGLVGIGTISPGVARLRVVHDGLDKIIQQWGGAQGSTAGQRFMELYSPATDSMNDYFRFQTGNAIKFRIDSTDVLCLKSDYNIGVGTDNPSQPLTLHRSSAGQSEFGLRFQFVNTSGPTQTSSALLVGSYGLKLKNYNSNRNFLFETGNVGIGTATPDHNLHVYQEAGDAVITIESTGNGNHSALEFMRTTSGGDSKGAGSIYVTGDTSESAAKMKFGVAHNIGHGVFPKMTIDGQNGHVGIGTENPVKALHVEHSDCRIRLTEVGEATDVELINNSGNGTLTTNGSSQLRFLTNNEERLIITAAGHIVTQDLGLTGTSFNNDTSNAKVFEVTGDGTVDKYGVINISGNSNSNSGVIGRIYFTNRENSNSSSVTSANSKALAYIDTYANSTDSNAGDDCGGILRFSTKRDGAGSLERIRITNDGRIGINDNSPNGYEVDLQNRSDSTGNDTQVRIYNTQTGSVNDTVMRYQIAGTTANNYIYFGDGDDANAGQIRYNHNSDFLALNVNAGEKIRITSGGDVGIGTNIPASKLHLFEETGDCVLTLEADRGNSASNENDNPYIVFKQDGSTANSAIGMNPNGVNSESNSLVLVNGAGSGAILFKTGESGNYTSGTSQRLRIEATGDVVIYNDARISGICTANTGFMFGTDGQHYLYQSASDRISLRITSDGPYAEFKDVSGDVQMGSASGTLLLSAGGNEKVRITSDGKVGINSTSPQTQLDVVGDDGLMIRTTTNGGASNTGGAVIKMTDQTPTDDQAGFIKFRHPDGNTPGDNYGSAFYVTSQTSNSAFMIGDFEFDNPTANNDLLVKTNIGIGTHTISRGPLQIHKRNNDDVQIHMTNNETGVGSGNGFTIFGGAGTNGRDMGFVNRETTGAIEFYTNIDGTLAQRGSWHTGTDITTFCINTASNGTHSNFHLSNHDTTDYNGVANRSEYPMLSDVHFTGSDNLTSNRTHAAWRNDVENSITTGSNSSGNRTQVYGIHSTLNSTKYAYILYGGYLFCNSSADNAAYTQSLIGAYGYAQGYINASSSVISANIYGGHFIGYRGGNTIGGHCYGAIARAQQTTNGVGSKTGDMTGMLGEVEVDEGQITNGYSFRAIIDVDNNTGDGVSAASTITSGYLYHGSYSVASGTTVTNRRGIWLVGCTDNNIEGTLTVGGDITAPNNKSFRIPHPLVGLSTTKDLVHAAIEGPQVDLIYRGKTTLVAGISTVNLDTKSGMTEGTFVALNRDVQCFTTNETGWTNVKGSVTGNQLTIIAQENTCTDTISWMVIGERQDDSIKSAALTDADGKLILEPDRRQEFDEDPVKYECEDNIHNADPNHNPKDD